MEADRSGIFISYRRVDAGYPAGWLYEWLAGHFGEGRVFKDVDSLRPGDDFAEVIRAALDSCAVLLAVIGPRWLYAAGADGRRRLDQPDDFVRQEIEAALRRDVPVVPVLVDGAVMPGEAQLPAGLSQLAFRHAVELRPDRFGSDAQRLLRAIHALLAVEAAPAARPGDTGDGGDVAGSVFDVSDTKRLRMELARWRFLSKLNPVLLGAPTSGRGYDRRSVDDFLRALRDVALEDIAQLQVHFAMASPRFPLVKGDGYSEPGVDLFMRGLNAAVLEYVTETSIPQTSGAAVLSQAEVRRQAEIARARFLGRVQPNFLSAGGRRGYDPAAVHDYVSMVRELAFDDMTRLLAYIATTPGMFPTIPRDGYLDASVALFISDLGHAARDYVEETLALYEDRPSSFR